MNADQFAASKRVVKQNPKTPKRLIVKVKKAMENTENTNNEKIAPSIPIDESAGLQSISEAGKMDIALARQLLGLPDDFEYDENTVFVDTKELNNLVQQNHDLKSEVGKLVGLFQHFTGLFSGANIMSIALKIPALIKDEGIKAQVEQVLPIIEKYKPKA